MKDLKESEDPNIPFPLSFLSNPFPSQMYKIAKGTQDLAGADYTRVQDLISRVEREFQQAGGMPLETPVFERTDVLLGKYGEEAETKLIYRLADEGGEPLSLRYDLTIPFTRYIRESGIKQMRRYSIGKVYRRDQPSAKTGRFREFYQADFDIYGEKQDGMLAEATLLNCVARVLKDLGFRFQILVNDVRNLEFLLKERLGLPDFRKYCSAIDKLDKQSFASLKSEFLLLGLREDQLADLEALLGTTNPLLETSQRDFANLCALGDVFGFRENLVFTNSLARGLDYYTGFIWEFKVEGVASTVSAGGRYDTLLGLPTVGISVGISRLATYVPCPRPDWKEAYYVATVGNVGLLEKMRVVKKLQDTTAEPVLYSMTGDTRKLNKIITECCTSYTRYVVIVGEEELAQGLFIIKDLKEKTQRFVAF